MPHDPHRVSKSPLCHESRAISEGVFIREVYSVGGQYDTTRCSKLPRDCAKKAVELINKWKLEDYTGVWAADYTYATCYECHTQLQKDKLPGGIHSGKEDCKHCHDVAPSHGSSKGRKK